MMRTTRTIATLGAFALSFGLAGQAGAASFVEITYDLSDTSFTSNWAECAPGAAACQVSELIGGSMKIRYASNSASSMPILHGPATLQSLTMSAHIAWGNTGYLGTTATTAAININLVSPVAGTLLSSGALTMKGAQIRVTGTDHCHGGITIITSPCIVFGGTITSIPGPFGPFTTTGTLSFAASVGPYSGAQSTRHVVSGTAPVYAPTEFVDCCGVEFITGAAIVGREILREAEGHDPKVTPEPGTLLLLGVGTAGLALVGRATRRSPRG